eukprot:TRINITY_DN57470_c0_g1_i1.p1 TRINITY_DN57470_c0_g1~~TRINITY_DN57470_c0_g1_i1.p1  ORF type:complete len:727 (+),score=32.35 TRINITY_DN57470_c0_g1_i1:55-2235(+)
MPSTGFSNADSPFLAVGCYVRSGTGKAQRRAGGRREATKNNTLDTLESLWASLTPALEKAKEEQEHADLPIIGIVEKIRGKECDVRVWKRGEEFYMDRPLEAVSMSKLMKMTKADFQKFARKPWMQHKNHQLQLKGEGNDEDMPISLIAYNNKLINDLLSRTYSKKNNASGLNPIDDPFSGIREELRQLTLDGLGGFRLKKRKGDDKKSSTVSTGLIRLAQDELVEKSFLKERSRCITPTIGTLSVNLTSKTGPRDHTSKSHISRLVMAEEDYSLNQLRSQLHSRKEKLSSTMHSDGVCLFGKLSRVTPDFAASTSYSTPASVSNSPLPSTPGHTSPQPVYDNSPNVNSTDEIQRPGNKGLSVSTTNLSGSGMERDTNRVYYVEEVFEEGEFTVVILPGPTPKTPHAASPLTPTSNPYKQSPLGTSLSEHSLEFLTEDGPFNPNASINRKPSTRSLGSTLTSVTGAGGTTNGLVGTRFRASLAGIVVPDVSLVQTQCGLNPKKQLESLILNKEIEAQTYGFTMSGTVRLSVTVDGTWVQAKLVQLGISRVATSLLSHTNAVILSGSKGKSSSFLSADDSFDPADGSTAELDTDKVEKLLAAQERAIRRRMGLWAAGNATSNFLRTHTDKEEDDHLPENETGTEKPSSVGESSFARGSRQQWTGPAEVVQVTTPLPIDQSHMHDTALPSLFEYSESSQDFRNMLPIQRQRALFNSSGSANSSGQLQV